MSSSLPLTIPSPSISESLLFLIPSPSVSIGAQTVGVDHGVAADDGAVVIAASMMENSNARMTIIADQRTQGLTGRLASEYSTLGLRWLFFFGIKLLQQASW